VGGASGASGAGAGGAAGSGGSGGIAVPPGYTLVWSDEFDVDGAPSSANWGYEHGLVRNNEAQYYQQQNANVQGGFLVITAKKEQVSNQAYQAGSTDWKTKDQYAQYSSSSLITSGKHSWQYGRWEMRAQVPALAGMWPAWWALGNSGEWPSNGEIDMFEYYNSAVHANMACGTTTRWTAKWDSVSKAISSFNDPSWGTKFHVWRMDWDAQKIDLYLDDQLINTANLADLLNPDGQSPFMQPAYMILNLALGGNSGGSLGNTSFPQEYVVDYVRVFQKM
jgi:beta-glucanase (GH16 family)